MLNKVSEIVVTAGLLIGSIVFWFLADQFAPSTRYAKVDSDLWPKIIFGTLILLTAAHLTLKLVELRRTYHEEIRGGIDVGYAIRLGLICAMVLFYYFTIQILGFTISTMIFLWVVPFILPQGSIKLKLLFSPIFTLTLGIAFSWGLGMPLPRGTGIFYSFSEMLF